MVDHLVSTFPSRYAGAFLDSSQFLPALFALSTCDIKFGVT
jgi:hypothetical protein